MAVSLRNRFIGKALADHALEQAVGAGQIIDAERLAVGKAEVELVAVALQVSLTDMVIGADDAALEDGEVRLDGVGVCRDALDLDGFAYSFN